MESIKGRLIVKKNKNKVTYMVSVPTKKGESALPIAEKARQFREEDAEDGIEVDVVREKGQPAKVTIPGKPERTPSAASRPPQVAKAGGPPTGRHGNRKTETARVDGVAPFNFVPADRVATGFEPVRQRSPELYSGRITCVLTALTPLLVAGPQAEREGNGPAVREFFTANRKPLIPGSSLKGMLRHLLESLSFAHLAPVSRGGVYYRSVGDKNEEHYNNLFTEQVTGSEKPAGAKTAYRPKTKAGFIEKRGADVFLYPAKYARLPYKLLADYTNSDFFMRLAEGHPDRNGKVPDKAINKYTAVIKTQEWAKTRDPKQEIGFELHNDEWHFPQNEDGNTGNMALYYRKVKTLGRGFKSGIPVFTGHMPQKAMDFIFYDVAKDPIQVEDAVWDRFEEQRTREQDRLLKEYKKQNRQRIPVFYVEDPDRDTYHIGLAQLFRVPCRKTPRGCTTRPDGAPRTGDDLDFCEALFGYAGETAQRGRVNVSHAEPDKAPAGTKRDPVVAGQPSPSCYAFYLRQPVEDQNRVYASVERRRKTNQVISFNAEDAALRGRKHYWHHGEELPTPPNENRDVQCIYKPLPEASAFTFHVDFDALTEAELGGLLEAIELPEGHAHKLGLGKPFGFGSVRIDINAFECWTGSGRYSSLRNRLHGAAPTEPPDRDRLRRAFRQAVGVRISEGAFAPEDYEKQPEIRAVRRMTDHANRPPNQATQYMPLNTKDPDTPSYRWKSILPDVEEVT